MKEFDPRASDMSGDMSSDRTKNACRQRAARTSHSRGC